MTKEELIQICAEGVVPVSEWRNRDSPEAQMQLARAGALIKAGCPYEFDETMGGSGQTVWLRITYPNFGTFDWGGPEETELFYLPTRERLEAADGSDWY